MALWIACCQIAALGFRKVVIALIIALPSQKQNFGYGLSYPLPLPTRRPHSSLAGGPGKLRLAWGEINIETHAGSPGSRVAPKVKFIAAGHGLCGPPAVDHRLSIARPEAITNTKMKHK